MKYSSSYWRNPNYNYLRFIMTVLVSCTFGSMYFKAGAAVDPMPFSSIQAIGGVIYTSTGFLGLSFLLAIMPLVAQERVVYWREGLGFRVRVRARVRVYLN